MSRRPRDTASARSHTNLPLATVHTRLRQLATAFAFAIALAIASAATFAFAFAAFTILAPIAPGTAVTAVTAPPTPPRPRAILRGRRHEPKAIWITSALVVVHPPKNSNAERCRTGRPRCVPALPPTPHPCRPILLNDGPGHKGQDHQRPAPSARSSTAHSPSCPAARPGRPPSSEGPVGSRTPPRLRCAPRSSRGRAADRHGLQTGPRARLPEGRQARGAPRAPTSRPTALGWGGGALSPRAAAKTSQTGAPRRAGAAGPPRA